MGIINADVVWIFKIKDIYESQKIHLDITVSILGFICLKLF